MARLVLPDATSLSTCTSRPVSEPAVGDFACVSASTHASAGVAPNCWKAWRGRVQLQVRSVVIGQFAVCQRYEYADPGGLVGRFQFAPRGPGLPQSGQRCLGVAFRQEHRSQGAVRHGTEQGSLEAARDLR